ncbi:hypothetical protein BDK51DRAFT_32189 [Blyttiomyces helicus]|uniref:Histidine phosphatase superfamily n=1 Tax=Blyttiomyces helicus TaxID=388810 RepID=A0A4V1IR25_9FUNG|nr:hypothetical protein BDK51DRAFT_32189 [Blyttiomyces helicus]|eukprot:RKO88577.1 hypothetical protein BDK51DRAFT_32189 [Blyttiomyces helicus]
MAAADDVTVILIRHAEKLTWHNGVAPSKEMKALYIDNHILSAKGYERAHALVGYFNHREEIQALFRRRPLAAIIAQDVDRTPDAWGRSERPRETVEPLATHLAPRGVVFLTYTKKQLPQVLSSIREFKGRTVIVSWAHQQIPDLTVALGVPAAQVPQHWPGKRFDVTWVVEPGSGTPATFVQYPQRLLFGDKDSVIDLHSAKGKEKDDNGDE